MEGDVLRLERATLRAQPSGGGGDPVLVHLEGWITTRPFAQPSQGLVRTLVVQRFWVRTLASAALVPIREAPMLPFPPRRRRPCGRLPESAGVCWRRDGRTTRLAPPIWATMAASDLSPTRQGTLTRCSTHTVHPCFNLKRDPYA